MNRQEGDVGKVPPVSILDTDLYKFTMQQAVFYKFRKAHATYRFTNRDEDRTYSRACVESFKESVSRLSNVFLQPDERAWLRSACPYFTSEYLDYLSQYRFDPSQVRITFVPLQDDSSVGYIDMEAEGPWVDAILWEVPLMSLLSEAYFRTDDTDWDYEGQYEQAYAKGQAFLEAGCVFNEFGTRRRRSLRAHDIVVGALSDASRESSTSKTGRLAGTSNVFLAYKYGLKPTGTIAHEWFMGVGAILGYDKVHAKALDFWQEIYHDQLLISLTDTFSTDAFFKDFTRERALQWHGLRQDSGDPFVYAPRAKAIYESFGVDPASKMIVFSDGLNVDLAKDLQKQINGLGMKTAFGVGTNFSNDFPKASDRTQKSKALNIVIKIRSINGRPCVKISDELTKNTGEQRNVEEVKRLFGI